MLYFDLERNALRLQVFRVDVQDHRDNTQGWSAYSRPRLMIGSFYLTFDDKITGCDWRLNLHDATLRGVIHTAGGDVDIEHYVHARDMVMQTRIDNRGLSGPRAKWTWEPEKAATTRPGYPRTPAEREAFIAKYGEVYRDTLEPFESNPEVRIERWSRGEVSIQDLLVGGQYAVAWCDRPYGNSAQDFIVSIEKTFPEREAAEGAKANIQKVWDGPFGGDFESHSKWWSDYYPASFVSIPDARLESFYWHQMYKMVCATRPDRPMMDTAGPWIQPTPWPYITWDLNVQLCYWPVCASNRLELGRSLVDVLRENQQNLIENVRPVEWQADSAYIPVATAQDLIGRRDGDKRYYNCVGNLPWAMHNVWLIYRYTMDEEILRETFYPLTRRAINLYRHLLIEEEDGSLHLPTTYSPEEGTARDCNYDLALLRWGCAALLETCERLDIDDPLVPEWRRILANLTEFPVDENGFRVGADRPWSRSHRHYSHLLMAYPLYLVNVDQGEKQRELIERSLKHWAGFKGALAGYSYTGASSISAAIGNGDDALEYLEGLARFLQPNGLYKESGPVMETPLSAAQSIHDMLLQSWGGTIRIFPAAPTAWPDVVYHDLRAEGVFLVSAKRANGQTQWVRIKSLAGEPCRVKPGFEGKPRVSGPRDLALEETSPGVYDLDLRVDEEVFLWTGASQPDFEVAPAPRTDDESVRFGLSK